MCPKTESNSNMLSFQGHDEAILHLQYWQTLSAIWKASTAFAHGYLTQVNLDSTLQLDLQTGLPLDSAVIGWLR